MEPSSPTSPPASATISTPLAERSVGGSTAAAREATTQATGKARKATTTTARNAAPKHKPLLPRPNNSSSPGSLAGNRNAVERPTLLKRKRSTKIEINGKPHTRATAAATPSTDDSLVGVTPEPAHSGLTDVSTLALPGTGRPHSDPPGHAVTTTGTRAETPSARTSLIPPPPSWGGVVDTDTTMTTTTTTTANGNKNKENRSMNVQPGKAIKRPRLPNDDDDDVVPDPTAGSSNGPAPRMMPSSTTTTTTAGVAKGARSTSTSTTASRTLGLAALEHQENINRAHRREQMRQAEVAAGADAGGVEDGRDARDASTPPGGDRARAARPGQAGGDDDVLSPNSRRPPFFFLSSTNRCTHYSTTYVSGDPYKVTTNTNVSMTVTSRDDGNGPRSDDSKLTYKRIVQVPRGEYRG
eukprot:TRINITY_DN97183_c0_g1_i1.p1 TRINITY_DN97183_c0_g1~~TRINITY_DN97183_c0_g1_i1.p1  ORF type:complete len:412 (+),score=74.47 TRINITY_DN97183_c0_g1_i1:169-1404(+)